MLGVDKGGATLEAFSKPSMECKYSGSNHKAIRWRDLKMRYPAFGLTPGWGARSDLAFAGSREGKMRKDFQGSYAVLWYAVNVDVRNYQRRTWVCEGEVSIEAPLVCPSAVFQSRALIVTCANVDHVLVPITWILFLGQPGRNKKRTGHSSHRELWPISSCMRLLAGVA
jgi:hypothetical protein